MATKRVKRKLTAILHADVKGYSRLMGEDEEATLQTLTNYLEVLKTFIQQYRGRVVGTEGDAILAEFASVVDAVQCAVEIQQVLKAKNADLPENRKMEFRIGINLGDVIEEGEQIYGDGVNIAARIEALAEGGGISISGSAYEQIKNKLALGYEYFGEHAVKNIAERVKVYRVPMGPRASKDKKAGLRRWQWVAVAAVVVLILGVGAWAIWSFYFQPPPMEPVSEEDMVLPLPDKPSIAVLPFENMSDDPEQEYLSNGIAEEIITALSKTPKLFVIARTSSFKYKGKEIDVRTVGRELGVRYVLEGSVRRAEEKVRITAQLINTKTNKHLWAERYDRDLKDIFAVQHEITKKIIIELQVQLTPGEEARLWARGTDNLQAYLYYLRGLEYKAHFNKEENVLTRRMAENVIALDPKYSYAYTLLGLTHMTDVWLKTSESPRESMRKAIELAQKAIAFDSFNADAYGMLGFLFTMTKQNEKGIAAAEKAVNLDPNSSLAHQFLGLALRFGGRPKDAIPVIEKAIRLNPFAPSNYISNLGLAYLFAGQHEKAIRQCKKATDRAPNNLSAQLALAVAYSVSGRDEEARAVAAEILRINPKFSVEYFSKTLPYKNRADKKIFITALRKAGLK
jgi:adenylate cyclase